MLPAETQRAGAQAGQGWRICPKCHCHNFRVLETRSGEDSKTRRRECRCGGYRLTTLEIPVSWFQDGACRSFRRRCLVDCL